MATIASALNKEHPENKPRSVQIVPEVEALTGPLRAPLILMLAAVGCVLLIVCADVANLLLARATAGKGKWRSGLRSAPAVHGRFDSFSPKA